MAWMAGRLITLAVLLAAAAPAGATLGNGIRVGGNDGRLHLLLDMELRYDSNAAFFYTPALVNDGDLILHVRPGLTLNIPGESLMLDFKGALDWAQYFGVNDSATRDLSNLYAWADLGLGYNRKGQVGVELDEKFVRSNQAQSYVLTSGAVSNYNDLLLGVPWRPGSGALTVTPAFEWGLESYQPYSHDLACDPTVNPLCDPAVLSQLGYNNLTGSIGLNWKFLPRTAAVFDASYFSRLPNSTDYSLKADGFRVQAGATGLVTQHWAATLKAGYGSTLNVSDTAPATPVPSNLGTWLATIGAEWLPDEKSSVKLTYNHDLGVDVGVTYSLYTISHVTLDARTQLGGRFNLLATVDWAGLGYQDPASTTSTVLLARAAAQAEFQKWLLVELAYQYTDRTTTLVNPPPSWQYTRNEIWLRGVVTY
jgi:hypothetical protein